jgi:WD40 repeat protein
VDTGNPVATFSSGFPDWVNEISFSQDNSMILGCDADGYIKIWAETGGTPLLDVRDGIDTISCIFHPDYLHIYYIRFEWTGAPVYRIKKKKISDGTVTLDYLVAGKDDVKALNLLPNSELLTFLRNPSSDELVFLNPTLSTETKVLAHNAGIRKYLFSDDGSKVYIASNEKKVSVWDISGSNKNKLWETDVLATREITGFTKSTMEDYLIVTSKDNKLIQLKTLDGSIVRETTFSNSGDIDNTVGPVIIIDDGKRLMFANKKINVLNFADFSVIKTIDLPVEDIVAKTIHLSNCQSCFTSLDSTSKKCKPCESTSGFFVSQTGGIIV